MFNAKEMFELVENNKNSDLQSRIEEIESYIKHAARRACYSDDIAVPKSYAARDKLKEHFEKLGFEVTEQEADKNEYSQDSLIFSWANPKDPNN